MIPVTQTKVVVKDSKGNIVVNGNCYAAAIASIMELPIEMVPNVEVFFPYGNTYWTEVIHTFFNLTGWELMTDDNYRSYHPELGIPRMTDEWLAAHANDYYFVSGMSSRGVMHICIYQNGKMIHDPHPTREGIITLEIFETLEKIKQ